jgi:oligoribonuclease (3'-5' exoribonuclease)
MDLEMTGLTPIATSSSIATLITDDDLELVARAHPSSTTR